MHSCEMVETAMATSGLLYKDEVHRGKEARTYLDPLLFFFATIMTRVFTDEVVRVIKKHQSQHAVSFDLLQEQPVSSQPFGPRLGFRARAAVGT